MIKNRIDNTQTKNFTLFSPELCPLNYNIDPQIYDVDGDGYITKDEMVKVRKLNTSCYLAALKFGY
jgi:hypothetical protein